MNRYPLIVASLVLAASGFAVWTAAHRQLATPDIPRHAGPAQTTATAGKPSVKRQSVRVNSIPRTEESITRLTVTTADPAEQENCRKLESEAHRTLAKITDAVALSASQKQRVFQILVRSADDFHPSMLIAGEPVGELTESPEDAICEVLNPTQETILLEAQIDDAAWWDDAIAQMEIGSDVTTQPTPAEPLTDIE